MDRVKTIEELQQYNIAIRSLRKGFITNFYLNVEKHSIWIENEELFVHETIECLFLLHKNDNFYHLFFTATSTDSLCAALQGVPFRDELLSIDVVGAKENAVKDALKHVGFYEYETIYRMRRLGMPESCEFDSDIEEATLENVHEVKLLLDQHFNALSEQIFSEKELAVFVRNHTLLLFRDSGVIRGFIIYELRGVTLYLRYWWVSPSCRNRGIGAKLFHSFLNRGKNTKCQIHWLIATNDNARVRYEHYGYVAEPLYDYVLLNKKV